MAAESIVDNIKAHFPQYSNSDKSLETTIEYIGEYSTLDAAKPSVNATWGDYSGFVKSTNITPVTGTDPLIGELTVIVVSEEVDSEPVEGTLLDVTYEIEWVMFQRSMYEHPEFVIGGGGSYELSGADVSSIEAWKNNDNVAEKTAYKYPTTGDDSATYEDLTANAQKFVKGIELGIETYEDYAPVVRKTSTYGGGLPETSTAGQKEDPPFIPGIPSGYEWRKQADRAIKNGRSKWEKSEEWIGAIKVLVDKDEIFW